MKLTCARPAVEKLWTMRWLLCLLATREPLLQLPNATAQAGLVKTENKYELYERVGIQEMRGESTLGFIFLQEVVQLSSVLLSCRSPLALRRFLTRYPIGEALDIIPRYVGLAGIGQLCAELISEDGIS